MNIIPIASLSAILLILPLSLQAQNQEVIFWNKMESITNLQITSEVGPGLNLSGSNWSFSPAMFNDGWDNNSESSFASIASSDIIAGSREGALAFWWTPDDAGDTPIHTISTFFSNGATNNAGNDAYGLELWYNPQVSPSFSVLLYKRTASGIDHRLFMNRNVSQVMGTWSAGDRVHIAFAWHNQPVILGQYIGALWVDGVLAHGWTEPTYGTLAGWETTNPVTPSSTTLRIGDSIYPYSVEESLRGPMDNVIAWNYAKDDYSDRFIESPFALPPTADAGPNQSIHAGDTVVLDGSGSYDDVTAGEDLLYDWSFIAIPESSTAVVSGANNINPSFIADLPGTYDVNLVVTDQDGLSSEAAQVSISSLNSAPNADAGTDQASYVGNQLTMDGSGSNDPDADPLNYSWVLLYSPEGSVAQLNDTYTTSPTIAPDIPGSYEVALTVNDGLVDSTPDSLTLVIITPEDFVQEQTAETINVVTELPPSNVTTSGNQQALTTSMKQIIKQVQKDNVDEATSKLIKLITRTDGCALRGTPDIPGGSSSAIRKDYINNCEDQAMIYPQLINALEALQ